MSVPECRSCGAHVTQDYVRVFAEDASDGVRVCPKCPTLIRGRSGKVRKARSTRHNERDGEVNYERSEGTKTTATSES